MSSSGSDNGHGNTNTGAELAVEDPLPNVKTSLMRAAARGDVDEVGKHLDECGRRDINDRTALMIAAQRGHTECVKLLIEKESGMQDKDGRTALMIAAQGGHKEVIKILLEHEKERRDNEGMTALIHAATNGRKGVVEILLKHEKGIRDNQNHNALYHALNNGHTVTARVLVELIDPTDGNGVTALMRAAGRGDVEKVRELIPIQKRARDARGRTALMLAASNAHIEAVRVLVECEKGITDEDGHTALIHAARAGHRETAEFLMEREKDVTGWTMLMCAAVLGDVEMVSQPQHLDEKGQTDKQGRTALILAAQNGREEVVKLLMNHESGVSKWTSPIYNAYFGYVNVVRDNPPEKGCKDVTKMTALMWAAHQGHREMVKLLIPIQKGMKDKDGNTAFMHALKNKHADVATLLCRYEAPSWTFLMCAAFTGNIELARRHLSDKDEKNNKGETALMIAAKAGHEDIVELLDQTDENGVTALMRAVDRGDVKAVKALMPLQKGAKITGDTHINGVRISVGATALMIAAENGRSDCVRPLADKEGGMQDSRGYTALMIAAENGRSDCVRPLADKEGGMQDSRGYTALMIAAENGRSDCVRPLADKEKGMKNNDGKTARMIAISCGHSSVVELLAKYE